MQHLSTCVFQTLRQLPQVFQDSGKFAFQYGHYDSCISDERYNYHMIEFDLAHLTTGITMGICLPKQCSNQLVTTVLKQAFKVSGQPIYIYRVVTNPDTYVFSYDWVFYLTLAIILTLVLTVAVASLRKERKGWMKAFSLQENWALLTAKKQCDMNVLNGVRVMTMMWVVMGNTFINSLIGAINVLTIDYIFQRPFILIIEAALLTVDIFFFIGGFFMAYQFAKDLTPAVKKYPLRVLGRLLRILPAYMLTILIWYSMFIHWGGGPRWVPNEQYTGLCKNMWRTALFIDNLVNNGHTLCMSWAFYMQLQMQVFLVSLVLLFIYTRHKLASLVVAIGLVAYSWTMNLMYTQEHGQQYPISFAALSKYSDYIFDIFIKPYARWTPYFFGMYIGLLYAEYSEVKNSKEIEEEISFRQASIGEKILIFRRLLESHKHGRRFFEWFGLSILAFVVFFPRLLQVGYQWPQAFHSMCLNFGRSLFPFAILMTVLPSLLGVKNTFIRTLLDKPIFNFMARISYGVYLVHGLVILYVANIKRYDTYFWIQDLYVTSLAVILLSCIFGCLLTVFAQLPLVYVTNKMLVSLGGKEQAGVVVSGMKEEGQEDQGLKGSLIESVRDD